MLPRLVTLLVFLTAASLASGQAASPPPATGPTVGVVIDKARRGFPHVEVDVARRQVRVACATLDVSAPLEFFCVVQGGPEHEAALVTPARPSHVHAALLALGLEPGRPVRYVPAEDKWYPPEGPGVRLSVEFERDGRRVTVPAGDLLRDVRTGRPVGEVTWAFVGSQVLPEHGYAADLTGYVASVVNFESALLDVPQLASNANELLEWRLDPDQIPPRGTPATLILEPAPPAPEQKAAPTTQPFVPPHGAMGSGR